MYLKGQGVPKDLPQAAAWFRKAADQGEPGAQNNLGALYEAGAGVPADYGQAAMWYRKAAEQGHATAQDNLGILYADGHGVPQDYQQALAWYRKAANQGYADAQDHLNALYASGHGVPQDQAQTGQPSSPVTPSSAPAATLPCTAASAQNATPAAQAQNSASGLENDPKFLDTAALRQRAIAGDARAQAELARRYDFGHGEGSGMSEAGLAQGNYPMEKLVAQDYAQAFYWYRKAAEQGLAEGQYELGLLYYGGHGVQKDYAKILDWVAKAACQGYSTAQNSLGQMYQSGSGVPRDIEQALAWFRKAAGQQDDGAQSAQTHLGDMYSNGTDVPQDYDQARLWYGKAAGHGDSYAKTKLQALNIQHPVVAVSGSTEGSHNGQNQQASGSQAVPNVLRMLDAAKSKKVELSGQDKKQIGKWYVDNCNKNDYVWGDAWNTSNSCAIISGHLEQILGLQSPAAETAYLRACAFTDTSRFHTNRCAKLGEFYERRSQLDLALAVYQHAPNCNQSFNFDKDRMGCLLGAARVLARTGNATAARDDYQVLCKEYSDAYSCGVLNELGEAVDAKAALNRSNEKDKADWHALRERNQQYDEEAAERTREKDESLSRTMNTIQAVGQAVQDVTNQQTAANAALALERQQLTAAQQQTAQRRLAVQQAAQQQGGTQVQATGDKFHCVGASGADSGYNNGCQLVPGTNSGANVSSGIGTGGNSSAGVVGTTGSGTSLANNSNGNSTGTASHYVSPVGASCISQFWDPKFYNWLSFQNNCGRAINLTYEGGISGATDGLGAGQATNTGWSQAEVTQKGVFSLYVCPAGYIPVDSSTDQVVNRPNQTFTCKQR
jgi:TPR repeat protein